MSEQEQNKTEDFNEVLEKVEVDSSKEVNSDENLQEFKASHGDPSAIPDATATKTDEKPKGGGDKMTKVGMITAMMSKLNGMKKDEVDHIMSMMTPENMAKMKKMKDEDMHPKSEMTSDKPVETLAAQVNKEDLDLSQDIDALFGDIEDKEFKEKATTMFEAAVLSKVNEQLQKFAAHAETDAKQSINEEVEKLSEKVDQYLDYVINEWVKDNKLAIERGVKSEITEDFLKGLKNLFSEHYVDIPEEKVDVVEEMVTQIDELNAKIKQLTDQNVKLSDTNKSFEKNIIFKESVKDLTDTQSEKLQSLVEGIEFSDIQDYTKKVSMIKEQYFKNASDEVNNSGINDDDKNPQALNEEDAEVNVAANMKHYVNAIRKQAAKN
jgi:hypothetical protein